MATEPTQPEDESKPELDIIEAIELAIAHETEARKSYLALAQESDDPELQRLLREIASEEAGHEASLRSRLRLYQERHMLRDTFSRYVSPELCEEILKNPGLLALGGRRQAVTVLFADIRNFTSMSEAMDPEAVVEVLNTYFTEMVDLVFHYQGTLDKFVGDALMAVFGVPVPIPQAADKAVECALAMQRHLKEMQAAGHTPIQGMRIGINTGEAIVGNIGSSKRMDFTVVGDVVNVAARLQELAKELEAETLISESTFQALEGRFQTRPEPAVVLRGRKEPTPIYRLEA
jgi:adenylate cyclase